MTLHVVIDKECMRVWSSFEMIADMKFDFHTSTDKYKNAMAWIRTEHLDPLPPESTYQYQTFNDKFDLDVEYILSKKQSAMFLLKFS